MSLVANFSGSFAPTGSVTFTAGGTTLGTAAVSGGLASLSTASLALGSHSLAASYAGDSNNTSASASTVTLTVSARSNMTWQYGYDAMGRPNTEVDPNGLASYTYWDALGRPIQTQQPANTGTTTLTESRGNGDVGMPYVWRRNSAITISCVGADKASIRTQAVLAHGISIEVKVK